MVSQFVSDVKVNLLSDLPFAFPEGTHAVGRLDSDSEGLLILTTNGRVTRLLFNKETPHIRTYLVKVKGVVSDKTLQYLQTGVPIRIAPSEMYTAVPEEAVIVSRPEGLFERGNDLPENAPHTWLRITLTEGRHRQVRKMVGALKHRCQRLIRLSIEDLELGDMQPGDVKELEEKEFFNLLKLDGN